MSTLNTSAVALKSVSKKSNGLDLLWSDGQSAHFHFLWLRDNCPSNFHPDTQERTFDQLSVSPDIHAVNTSIQNNHLIIDWSEQQHSSQFDTDWLRNHAYSKNLKPKSSFVAKSWDSHFTNDINSADYDDLLKSDEVLYQWMKTLNRDGLILVKNMPSVNEALTNISDRIDYQRRTNFGITFEVISEEKPINLAYTSLALPLHTDLSNQETPPGYQFLHCLANVKEGGESTFSDGLRVLEDLRKDNEHFFNILAQNAIPFRFHDEDHDIRHHHPVINLDHESNIVELKYNAHIASIFDLPEDIMHEYYLAYRELMARVRDEKYKIRFKMEEGTMAVFDNRRVLHGREAFEPNGKRHLRGCYVDRTEFQSRLRVLAKQHENA